MLYLSPQSFHHTPLRPSNVGSSSCTSDDLPPGPGIQFSAQTSGLKKWRSSLFIALVGFIGMNASGYFGLKSMTAALKPAMKTHAKAAAEQTGRLLSQDGNDLRKDIAEIKPFHSDALLNDAKKIAKDKMGAIVGSAKEKYSSIKQLAGKFHQSKNIDELENLMEQLSPDDLEMLKNKHLKDADKAPLETVQRFKADLDALLKKRVENTHVKPKQFEPIIEAAIDDAASIIMTYGGITASAFSTTLALFLFGLIKTIQQRKEESLS